IAVLDNLSSILQTQLANGYSIDLGFCLLRPELKGNFSSYEEKFSRKKHRIDVSFFPGKKIIKSLKMATARKTTNLSPTPIISHLRPVLDRGKNVFHRGDMISIVGKDLKFTETETEGVFLLPNRSKQETRVAEYFCIKPSEVGIKIPDLLSPGTYVLVLRVFFGDTLKEEKYSEPIQIN
ncbi:MAG: DUF4469 domain-containing protein, partial [Leptospiraceae bacterium]|nr:DUF4469 domain-containing protein [Leptospiraceae bacterium]